MTVTCDSLSTPVS